ncbi:hypothetical protein Acr_26g0003230 [Actinidia rufa]|uniref:Uncharacterized protein n=1 Tax=Actinidia rufa TaxID=165716 RepID=A0A7J0H1T2_9ERIC|nr:hypothetical protein Acr_26g0003230 [Actinidia rufa]
MQCTSFLPECYSSRDLNVGANGGTWTLYNNERILTSGHARNVFLLPTEDQVLVYKEVLRQTILKHESIFRDQVHELHRLYRRQRELMDDIKRRELSKQNFQLQTSHSNSFLRKISSESAQTTCQIPSLPWLNRAGSKLSITENLRSTSSFFACKTTQASPETAQIEDNLKDRKLSHSKCEKPKRKMLDLELPPDEYIDLEEENQFEEENVSKVSEVPSYPTKRMPVVSQTNDLELFGHGGLLDSICQGGASSPNACSRRTSDLADLNEPIWLEDAVVSNSVTFTDSDTHHKIIPCLGSGLSGKPNSSFQEDMQQENVPRNHDIGQNMSNLNCRRQVSSLEKLPMPFEQLKLELPANFNLLDECDGKLQNQGTNSVKETSERIHDLCNDDNRGLGSYSVPTLYQLVPQPDFVKSEPSSVSSQRKPTRNIRLNPIAVQALPCFNVVVPSSKSTKSSATIPPRNGNRNVVSTKAVDLNMPPSPYCLADSEASQENVGTEDGVKKHEDSSHADLVLSQDFPTSVCDVMPKRFKTNDSGGNEKMLESRVSTDQVFARGLSSDSNPDASEDKYNENNQNAVVVDANLTSRCVLDSGKQCIRDDISLNIIVDGSMAGVGSQIDLNCCINEDECSPPVSIPMVNIKTPAFADLEAPISPENMECSPPRGESEENQETVPINVPKQEDSDYEDELVWMAAEAVVLISTPGFQKQLLVQNIVYETLEASPAESLSWFAGIVSAVADDLENSVGEQQELSSDGSEYFEAMTLELTEAKVDEYWCKSNGPKEEETSGVSSSSQLRRDRALRGRQRKHFQTEVLPSLASLSRHEVTEDLQTIGGLMEAAGFPVETSLGRRNAFSRARRRSGNNSFFRRMETTACSLGKQRKNDNDLTFRETSLQSWGKMNRRRRGPRTRARNLSLLFS